MLQTCFIDEACDFMYYCQNGTCKHYQIFPIQLYPALIYILIPIACGLCNLSGNAMGMFKILILMNLLRYTIQDATALIQAVVVGAALPNFIQIINERHPNGKTSLVNFNIVIIFIPCSLYGSTLGSLLESILPEFIQDLLIFGMFTYFSINFIQKARAEFRHVQQQKRQSLITIQEARQSLKIDSQIKNEFNETNQAISLENNEIINNENIKQKIIKVKKSKKLIKKSSKNHQIKILKKQIKNYQKSIHLRDILASFIVFLLFQCIVFFAQGKIPYLEFDRCTVFYPLGLAILTLTTTMYLFVVKKQMLDRFQEYRKVKFNMQVDLSNNTGFWKLVLGGFGAGFVQGTLGLGAGTFLMTVMLSLNINPRVAAATSGFQTLFTGSAALTQQFINNSITFEDALFFFLWTAISGGIVTFVLYRVFRKIDEKKTRKILFALVAALCVISQILIFPVTIQRISQKGWDQMFKIHFSC